jgi:glucose-1-phosphate thymidylyltransferase
MKNNEYVGIVPAAGKGSRMASFFFPKELTLITLPNNKICYNNHSKFQRSLCEFALECLTYANINTAYVIINNNKYELINFLKDGQDFGLNLSYIYQPNTQGLPFAIDSAFPFIRHQCVSLVLPDAIIEPSIALKQMLTLFKNKKEDIILGVFEYKDPTELCQVVYDENYHVIRLYDKSSKVRIHNTWGMAAWRPRFNDFLHNYLKEVHTKHEISLAEVFNEAIAKGIEIVAHPLKNSVYIDIGSPISLRDAISFLSCTNKK